MKIRLRRILVPTDFSDKSGAALTYAIAFVEQFGASLHLLHVVETLAGGETLAWQLGPREDFERAIESSAWEDLRRLLSPEDHKRLRAEVALQWGTPFVEIIRYARTHEIDLIAMGTHGRNAVKHLLMGSVAENVVRSSPCPVLTVRHPEHEFVLP
jgi:nucleotide-binding universal stress UspA family protein